MREIKVGDRVRVTRALLDSLHATGDEDQARHADELDGQVGTVILKPAGLEHWPEVHVRWNDLGLQYLYDPEQLEVVDG